MMDEPTASNKILAEDALKDDALLRLLVERLSDSSRRVRQQSAQEISSVAKINPEIVVPYGAALVDALNRPEAQTRWECLDALTVLVAHDSRLCEKALPAAEAALFDEESGPVRLAAMKFLCQLGSTTESRSEKVWPLIDEAIQCYHGDLEFSRMLVAVIDFSSGKLSDNVKKALVARMEFDAAHGKGPLKRRAAQIIENAS